ncbi:hypothetical protein GGI25_001814 [Coemansia spiralis]|uniref:Pyridoxal phosphate homeostasis protein n=2 Tax=Coemansia TaxID=4863 RepID=A0A9W8G581_9FUNG|nr:hypothetical protein BX070DRAFT_191530 [Coemansia spiralis]KAJ1993981.1 hypothetical protein EDC05_001892 [Coemansia umbellata]KAJ2622746.1 hypothetical protein GGI26_003015 [Coemansia sp. RSA 1358]KAJ2679042.1 hypothetical protein GGI25_001814 [Coemansia spiralis]
MEAPSSERKAEIAKNLFEVNAIIKGKKQQRSSLEDARLVAVSKYKPASDIQAAYESGQRHFGENYVQELCEKAPVLPKDIQWHFTGRLQSNKCKILVAIPNLWAVETIDSATKAQKLDEAWKSTGHARQLNVYVQVNTSKEENKGGVEKHAVEDVVRTINETCKNLRMLGLMTIGSIEGSHQRPNPDFLALVELRDGLKAKLGVELELSMGMSDDFDHALELGSSNVRVGSKIFGSRPPKD